MKTIGFLAAALVIALASAKESIGGGDGEIIQDQPQGASPSGLNLAAQATNSTAGAAINGTIHAGAATNGTTDGGATDAAGGAAIKKTSDSDVTATVGTNTTDEDSTTHKDSTKEDHGHSHAGTSGAASVAAGSVAAVTAVVVTYFL